MHHLLKWLAVLGSIDVYNAWLDKQNSKLAEYCNSWSLLYYNPGVHNDIKKNTLYIIMCSWITMFVCFFLEHCTLAYYQGLIKLAKALMHLWYYRLHGCSTIRMTYPYAVSTHTSYCMGVFPTNSLHGLQCEAIISNLLEQITKQIQGSHEQVYASKCHKPGGVSYLISIPLVNSWPSSVVCGFVLVWEVCTCLSAHGSVWGWILSSIPSSTVLWVTTAYNRKIQPKNQTVARDISHLSSAPMPELQWLS